MSRVSFSCHEKWVYMNERVSDEARHVNTEGIAGTREGTGNWELRTGGGAEEGATGVGVD